MQLKLYIKTTLANKELHCFQQVDSILNYHVEKMEHHLMIETNKSTQGLHCLPEIDIYVTYFN